ncbi:hypothetical protein [Peredibacter starrii]|uniref:Uncharacterized protein n=1 Tax=Peredibacter starrii TaxID=28202 RepID=A0AAX4HJK5_9BACT|nr:hypothetical protein [Peredibacter starrii]WPU63219.1 hypothetical protein SOO65_11040 [Peredibacter starrii]
MKSTLVFILSLTSLSALAQRMCPTRTFELVACREQNSISISICENKDKKLAMVYRRTLQENVEIYETKLEENNSHYIFRRVTDSSEQMELQVQKTIDDHAPGFFTYSTPTIQTQITFRCLTRLQTQW